MRSNEEAGSRTAPRGIKRSAFGKIRRQRIKPRARSPLGTPGAPWQTAQRRFEEPARHAPVRRRGDDVLVAGIDHGEPAKQRNKRGNEDGSNDAHNQAQNQMRMPKAKRTSPALSPDWRPKFAVCPNFP